MKSFLSVIIPVGPEDNTWPQLLDDLSQLDYPFEVILATANDVSPAKVKEYQSVAAPFSVKVVSCPLGRAQQMNHGARHSQSSMLCFLHSDSRLGKKPLVSLKSQLESLPWGLHYFDLTFGSDPFRLMRINEVGVWLRTRFLKIPFGDQGFLLPKDLFWDLGGFSESCDYGEDHLFIWACHQASVPVKPLGITLETSPRKYQKNGWLATTGQHLLLTWRQAVPEAKKLLRQRWNG